VSRLPREQLAPAPGISPARRVELLTVRGLSVRFYTYDGVIKALDGVSFAILDREIFGVVGETGCGKSVTAKAILRLIPDPPGRITGGEVVFEGINLLDSIDEEAHIRINRKGRAKIRRNRRIARRMEALMRTIRGNEISMIFQEPSAALNPVMTVEDQVGEAFLTHQIGEICSQIEKVEKLSFVQRRFFRHLQDREAGAKRLEESFRVLSVNRAMLKAAEAVGDLAATLSLKDQVGALEQAAFRQSLRFTVLDRRIRLWRAVPVLGPRHLMKPIRKEVKRRAVEMLKQVNIPDPERKAQAYPFELSGGMQQRIMIAMALACRPRLLLADEPTTALDVTIQAQILTLIRRLRDKMGSSIMLITHDLGVVAETCDRVGVMYAGVMAEVGEVSQIFSRARHPYTVGLLRSIPETYARTGKLSIIPGSVPSLLAPPQGCRFHPRCPFASRACAETVPLLAPVEPGHLVACHLYDHPEYFPAKTIAARDRGLGATWEEVVAP
jgi:peptide/nickel transport system ATP-binding protein